MMPAAEWDRELIADLAAERAGLGKSEVVGVRGLAAAHEARLLGDIAQVLSVAIAPRCSDREDALVDALRLTGVGAFGGGDLPAARQSEAPKNHRSRTAAASDDGSSDSLRSKASSTSLASVAVRLFLAVSAPRAQRGSKISRRDVPNLGQQLFAQRGRLLGIEG